MEIGKKQRRIKSQMAVNKIFNIINLIQKNQKIWISIFWVLRQKVWKIYLP
jgi:hypothetical protein